MSKQALPIILLSLFLVVNLQASVAGSASSAARQPALPPAAPAVSGTDAPGADGPGAFDNLYRVIRLLRLAAPRDYTLQPGDTITKVAKDNGLSVETVLSYNHIKSPRLLRPEVVLKLPSCNGVIVPLAGAESVESLAATYSADPELIRAANPVAAGSGMLSGEVFVPGAKMDPTELRKIIGEYFAWPTAGGRISSRFGKRNDPITGLKSSHTGVDIANYWGAPVYAAGDGRVIYADYNSVLGNHIKVDQGQGYVVVYGHLSSMLAKPGDKVRTGQLIGKVGSTGYSTGPHLHFSAYRWGRLLDPMTLFG